MNGTLAWKVVQVYPDGTLNSSVWTGEGKVRYHRRKWATPHKNSNPFLFVFNTRTNARRYIPEFLSDRVSHGQKFRIFRCKVRELREHTLGSFVPDGTMFANAVKLI